MKVLGGIFAGLVTLVALTIVGFGLNYAGYLNYRFFAPKLEAVRRDTMIQSRAYVEGETRNLFRLKLQYQDAVTPEAKQTVKLAAAHECESIDTAVLPIDVATFCELVTR